LVAILRPLTFGIDAFALQEDEWLDPADEHQPLNAMRQLILLVAVGLSLSPRQSLAATIYDTGRFTADGGAMASDFSLATNRVGLISRIQRADDFALQNESHVTCVNWWGLYAFENTPQGPDDFTIRIFTDTSGSPSTTPLFQFSLGNPGRMETGVNSFGHEVYAYSAILPSPVTLEGGTTYWLSIVNNTVGDGDDNWYWQRVTRFSGDVRERNNDASPWIPGSDSGVLAFNLQGVVVPEPATWALMLFGAVFLPLVAREESSERNSNILPRNKRSAANSGRPSSLV
jgi:hypothetical protein